MSKELKKVIPTLTVDDNLIGDTVTVNIGDEKETDISIQSVDTDEFIGNELVFYGAGTIDSIVSVLKGVSGSVSPTNICTIIDL